MSLEDRFAQHDKVIVDKYVNPAADYYMTTRDYVVRPTADGDSGAFTVYLPPVAEAKGRKCDRVLAYSDGLCWFVAASVTTFTGTTPTPTTIA